VDRLRGNPFLVTSSSTFEASGAAYFPTDVFSSQQTGVKVGTSSATNGNTKLMVAENFARAPNFFDIVCYTGVGAVTTQAHNLQAVPELMFVKYRDGTSAWKVYCKYLTSALYELQLNNIGGQSTASSVWNSTDPTASVFTLGGDGSVNGTGGNYVAHLFATCAGVSKVGSFTGNGSTQTIACGFTGGARFVLIKSINTTGNWFYFDTARGMTTSTDPYIGANLSTVEVATTGACTTTTGGFAVDESKLTGINTSGTSYIFLAIA
jgi:hypothetical protein